jgi:hypothetical protein
MMVGLSIMLEHLTAHSPLRQEERPSFVVCLAFYDPMNRSRLSSGTIPIPLRVETQ